MNQKIKKILGELRQILSAIYGDRLVKLVLFGSQARGDAQFGSDIDVLVVLKGQVDPISEGEKLIDKIVQWNLEYGELVSCVYVNEERFKYSKTPLLLNVRREGVSL